MYVRVTISSIKHLSTDERGVVSTVYKMTIGLMGDWTLLCACVCVCDAHDVTPAYVPWCSSPLSLLGFGLFTVRRTDDSTTAGATPFALHLIFNSAFLIHTHPINAARRECSRPIFQNPFGSIIAYPRRMSFSKVKSFFSAH